VLFGRSWRMFRRNLLPPSSGHNNGRRVHWHPHTGQLCKMWSKQETSMRQATSLLLDSSSAYSSMWRCRRHISPKRWLTSNKLHGIIPRRQNDSQPPPRKPTLTCRVPVSSEWESSVGIATGYWLDDRRLGVRVPIGLRILSSPRRPDRLWGPPSLLSNGYRVLFPRG
jgi:hypothetical protein